MAVPKTAALPLGYTPNLSVLYIGYPFFARVMRLTFLSFKPKTFFLRSLLILLITVLLMHSISGFVFLQRHWAQVSLVMYQNIANNVSFLTALHDQKVVSWEQLVILAKDQCQIHLSHSAPRAPQDLENLEKFPLIPLKEVLGQKITVPFSLYRTHRTLFIHVKKGSENLQFAMSTQKLGYRSAFLFVVWVLGSSALFLIIAALVLRGQVAPLKELALWAQNLDLSRPLFRQRIKGAREIRKIALAIRTLAHTLQKNHLERNQMLLGVSHDLRTLLARMTLQIKLLPPCPDLNSLQQDVQLMADMIANYLNFARYSTEKKVKISVFYHVTSLVKSLVIPGLQINLNISKEVWVWFQPIQFKRCLHNLLDNAQKYGHKDILLIVQAPFVYQGKSYLYLAVEDDGQRIPQQYQDDIFRPFFRLQENRPLKSGGSGLGLSVVKQVVLDHRGKIFVREGSCLSGNAFILLFPLEK